MPGDLSYAAMGLPILKFFLYALLASWFETEKAKINVSEAGGSESVSLALAHPQTGNSNSVSVAIALRACARASEAACANDSSVARHPATLNKKFEQ